MVSNLYDLRQKLHDLVYCREPIWEDNGWRTSRASLYFDKPPTDEEVLDLADVVAKEVASYLAGLPQDHNDVSLCEHSLTGNGYDFNGIRVNKRGTKADGTR